MDCIILNNLYYNNIIRLKGPVKFVPKNTLLFYNDKHNAVLAESK